MCMCDVCAGSRAGEEGDRAPVTEVTAMMSCLGAGNRTQVL